MNYVTDITEKKENVAEEIWRDVPGYEGLYKVSNLGNVLSFKSKKYPNGKPMKTFVGNSGYIKIALCKEKGNKKSMRLNRIVCETFHGKPPTDKHHANHINGIKSVNHASNLEWSSPLENIRHAYATGLKKNNGSKKRKVIQKTLNGDIIKIHPSVIKGANEVDAQNGYGVTLACQKKLKTYKGFIWDYADETELAQ